jgi:opacity protein-like surface antigen
VSFRCLCRLIAAFAAGWTAIPNAAAQPYLGLGVSRLALSSQYSALGTQSRTGFTMIGGIEFLPTWFAELAVSAAGGIATGPTENINYPPDTAEYSVLRWSVGKHFWPIAERGWTPWVAAGWGYNFVNWDTYYYVVDGTGLSLGAGVDFEPVRPWRVRVQAMQHRFSGHDTYGYGPYSSRSNEIAAAVIFAFR